MYNHYFERIPVALLLNKFDRFVEEMGDVDMREAFPEYKGGPSVKNGLEFIQTQYKRALPPKKEHHIDYLSAIDPYQVKRWFAKMIDLMNSLYQTSIRKTLASYRLQQRHRIIELVSHHCTVSILQCRLFNFVWIE